MSRLYDKWNYKCFVIMLFGIISCTELTGQDIHFSQFNNSPLTLNPALIGNFNGNYRFIGNHRNQWRSITKPFNTFGLSVENKNTAKTPFNVGLSLYNDRTGDSEYNTFQIAVGASYNFFTIDSSHHFQIGILPAFVQRNINYDRLQFDNQYNGSFYDPNLDHEEQFSNNGGNYLDLNAGIHWKYKISGRKMFAAGISSYNLFTPNQTFFNQNVPLRQRIMIHANALFMASPKLDVLPNLLLMRQHEFKEIVFGGAAKYHLHHGKYRAVYLGLWYRNQDASYISAALDYADFHFEVSYDVNISSLEVASNNKGAYEFSVIYILHKYKPKVKRYTSCPSYI